MFESKEMLSIKEKSRTILSTRNTIEPDKLKQKSPWESDNEYLQTFIQKHKYEIETINKILEKANQEKCETTKESKWQHIKKEIVEWSLLTKFDAYSKIYEEKNIWIKIIWILFFLLFTGVTIWLVAFNINGFLKYEVSSLIEIKTERPTVFPAVTVCNSNPFPSSQAQSLMDDISLEYFNMTFDNMTFNQAFSYAPNLTELTKMFVNSPLYNSTQRLELEAIPIIPSYFYFNNQNSKNKLGLYFRRYFLYDYGDCYQFNMGVGMIDTNTFQFLKQKGEGNDYGLTLQFGPYASSNKYMSSFYDGLIIFVHNQSHPPESTSPIKIEIGKFTSIGIERTFTHNEKYPYTECKDLSSFSSELYNLVLKSNYSYRQADCFNLCLQRSIINKCNCFYTRYTQMYNAQPCLNLTDLSCIQDVSNDFEQDECINQCPLECDSIKYSYSLSNLVFPSQSFYSKFYSDTSNLISTEINYNIDLSTIESYKKYYLMLNVFYPYLEYTQITESPKFTWIDLLSQIGGSLGMFLGYSIFHFIEICEILLKVLFVLFGKH